MLRGTASLSCCWILDFVSVEVQSLVDLAIYSTNCRSCCTFLVIYVYGSICKHWAQVLKIPEFPFNAQKALVKPATKLTHQRILLLF